MNKAIIKTDRIEERMENMSKCSTRGAHFSADWKKPHADSVYKQSMVDCYTVFAKALITNEVRDDYKELADECLGLLKKRMSVKGSTVSVKLEDDKALQSFVCFQFERYALRILAGSREQLSFQKLGFGLKAKEEKPAKAPAKQEKPAKQSKKAPAKQEADVLQQILAGVNGLNTRMERVEQGMEELSARVTALENKPKRTRKAKENVES